MERRKIKKNNGFVVIKGLLVLGTLSAAIFSGYYYAAVKGSDVIYNGVYVENINLSGKKQSEAENLLKEKFGQTIISKIVEIKTTNNNYLLEYNKLEPRYNISEIVKEAVNYGKEGNILERYKKDFFGKRKDFNLTLSYNPKPIDEFINNIEKEINKPPVNARVSINNDEVKIIPEIYGVKLQKDKLKNAIITVINDEPIDGNPKVAAAVETFKPEITSEKLTQVNCRISSFSTDFATSISNRINNIELAAKAISGTILMPGEIFSFNETVGERTKERGFKEAGVIIGDKMETGLGGGICQVSSTLYNAVLTANLKIEERTNHSLPLAYISKGLDATVNWENIDLKFKNTLKTPIYIDGYTKNKNLYFDIYSNKDFTKRSYKMVTDVYEEIQPSIKYIDDPNLDVGKTQVIKKGSLGYKVKVYRKTFENSNLVNAETISNDYYMPVNEEVAIGTKNATLN